MFSMTLLRLNIREKTASRLDHLAKQRKLSSEEIATSAIEEFVESEEWRIAEIEAGIQDADGGDFASAQDVKTVLAKFNNIHSPQK
jgi:predicted transcriptional regulator